jgi:pimeloyl-ACP methyl ester carboxylesterase
MEGAEVFLELAPHTRFVDVADAHHMVAGDRNDIFTSAVAEFLGEIE